MSVRWLAYVGFTGVAAIGVVAGCGPGQSGSESASQLDDSAPPIATVADNFVDDRASTSPATVSSTAAVPAAELAEETQDELEEEEGLEDEVPAGPETLDELLASADGTDHDHGSDETGSAHQDDHSHGDADAVGRAVRVALAGAADRYDTPRRERDLILEAVADLELMTAAFPPMTEDERAERTVRFAELASDPEVVEVVDNVTVVEVPVLVNSYSDLATNTTTFVVAVTVSPTGIDDVIRI